MFVARTLAVLVNFLRAAASSANSKLGSMANVGTLSCSGACWAASYSPRCSCSELAGS